jgi:hypothetical protein
VNGSVILLLLAGDRPIFFMEKINDGKGGEEGIYGRLNEGICQFIFSKCYVFFAH